MPRFSRTSKCAICGKEVSQTGPARQWVHENEFYAKADHPADPAGSPYVAPKRAAAPAVKQPEPAADKSKDAPAKARSLAELRLRLLQGSSEIAPDDSASRRRRIAALDAADTASGPTEADLAARRLRMMRQAAEDEQKR